MLCTPGRRIAIICLGFLAAIFGAAAADPGAGQDSQENRRIPIESFFGSNAVASAQLSPDGSKVAFLAPKDGMYGIAVLDLATRKVTVPVHFEDENINGLYWKGNDHFIFSGYMRGFEVPQVASADLEGKKVFSILEPQTSKFVFSAYSGEVVSLLGRDPGHIMILGFTEDSDQSRELRAAMENPNASIYRVSVRNGERRLVCPASESIPNTSLSDFLVDHSGRVRAAKRNHGNEADLLYRDDTGDPWRVIGTFRALSVAWELLAFTADDQGIYVIDWKAEDTGALRILDPRTRTLGPVLFSAPDGEMYSNSLDSRQNLVFSPDRGRLLGVRYVTDRAHVQWFDAKFAALQARLDKTFPDTINVVVGISDDESRVLIRTYSDRDPGAIYLMDLNRGTLGIVTQVLPGIKPESMAPMLPISFEARDGLTIHGYLTMPPGSDGRKPPLIVNPHGGPFGVRDTWGFDREVQFLANRGYAVLRVNYRGSGGYGSRFLHAGYGEWGGRMQDDLTDAVRWAVAAGYADPARIAIYGASYGGYAALAGITFTPELYKCAVNYVGVTDLVELGRRKEAYEDPGYRAFIDQTQGKSRDFLASRSPVNFVDRIRVPTLHAYGDNDPRVDIAQWKELKAQLDRHNKPYEFMVGRNEGHGFTHTADAIEFYSRLEAFLKRNL